MRPVAQPPDTTPPRTHAGATSPAPAASPGAPETDIPAGRLIRRFWRDFLSARRGTIGFAIVLMAIEGSTLGLLSYTIAPLFDRVFVAGEMGLVWWMGGAIFALFTVRALTLLWSKTLLTRVGQETSMRMQVSLLRHLLRLDLGFFQRTPPGALMEQVQGDTDAVQRIWQAAITAVFRDVVALAGLLIVAVMIDPIWTLAALVGVPVLLMPVLIAQRYVRRKTVQARSEAGLRSTRLNEIFHGIQPIKLNQIEGYQVGRFERIVDRIVRAEVRVTIGQTTVPSMIDIVTGLGFFLVLLLGARDIADGTRTVGEFMSFFTAMALTFQPIRRLGDHAGLMQVAAASLQRIYRLFDIAPTVTSPARPAAPPAREATEVRFDDVTLSYGELPVLRGLSFTAPAGRTTALVGPSGAGKSTVFNLLTRLIDPQSGRITLGGIDVRDMTLDDLRAQFSVVAQDPALFDETIRENITLGAEGIAADRLAAALSAARVDDFIDRFPGGIETQAGPRGSALSGGQRQRVAIARALLRDAPVLLLDEATSALDAASERLVQEALDRLAQGRTTLVIAHRLATVRNADRIVVMEAGRVVDQGTHEELLARGGLYADLCRLQFGPAG